MCLSLIGIKGQAQSFADDLSFSLDWQMNAPIGKNDYANKFSVWGMNLDAGYEITSQWTAGVFASFHTNHRYVGRETFPLSPTASLTTDQHNLLSKFLLVLLAVIMCTTMGISVLMWQPNWVRCTNRIRPI